MPAQIQHRGGLCAKDRLHPQTLRVYERAGLVGPARTAGGTRRYSRNDVARLREICVLTGDGLNLAGIRRVLAPQAETERLQAEIGRMRGGHARPVGGRRLIRPFRLHARMV